MTQQLDSFESALLSELRAVVSARTPQHAPRPHRPHRPHRSRGWLVAGAGVAAASVAAILVVPGLGPQPAYSLSVDESGEVHVRVQRLEDAQGLERALEDQGIAADVTYLADDTRCAEGRYVEAVARPGAFRFSVGDEHGYSVDLAPGVIGRRETLVIAASRTSPTGDPDGDGISDEGGVWASIGVASGAVGPCVPAPL